MTTPHERLRELGYELPPAPAPLAAYVPTRTVPLSDGRALVYVAGQIPTVDGVLLTGRVPDEVSPADAQEAARRCALNILAQLEAAAGLENVEMIAQLTGWVYSAPGFAEQPAVLNGASELLGHVLGPAGSHTRAAVGANELPKRVTVEIAAVALVKVPATG